MTKFLKKPLSILLAVLMVMSVFIAVPMTASAVTQNDINDLYDQMHMLAMEREEQDDYDAASALYSFSTVLDYQFYESGYNTNDPNVERAYNIASAVYNHFNGTGSVDVTSVSRTEVDKLAEALQDLMYDYMMSNDRYNAMVLDCAEDILQEAYSAADGNSEDQNLLSAYSLVSFILAQYTGTTGSYTVTWKNWNGDVLETDTVAVDSNPSYDGAAPTRPEDANNTYTFAAWDDGTTTYILGADDLPPVTGDVTYTAVYTADPKGINYGGDDYIKPDDKVQVSDEDPGKTGFGLGLAEYLNMQMLGIQKKSDIATVGGDDGIRFITAVNTNLLKGDKIADYGYIVVKAKEGTSVDKIYQNMDKLTYESVGANNRFRCKDTSNTISGTFGDIDSDTPYKYVTLSLTGTSGSNDTIAARFYVKTTDGEYHYAKYIKGNDTFDGIAFNLADIA